MIICEGPDLGGKSTVTKQLADYFGMKVYHAGGPPKTQNEFVKRVFEMENYKDHMVFDRSPLISELVYGAIIRDRIIISPAWIFTFIENISPLIIYCRPSIQHLTGHLHIIHNQSKDYKPNAHRDAVKNNYMAIVRAYDYLLRYLLKQYVVEHDFRQPIEPVLEAVNEY